MHRQRRAMLDRQIVHGVAVLGICPPLLDRLLVIALRSINEATRGVTFQVVQSDQFSVPTISIAMLEDCRRLPIAEQGAVLSLPPAVGEVVKGRSYR